jgi:hypothetical protein
VVEVELLAHADVEAGAHRLDVAVAGEVGRDRDVAPAQLGVVARPVGRLGDADAEDRHARLEEDVVVVAREEQQDVRPHPAQALRHAAVHPRDLPGRGRAVRDPPGEVRVVGNPEAADDLRHRWSIMITA